MLMIYYGHRIVAIDDSQALGPDIGNVMSPQALDTFLRDRRDWTAVSLADLKLRGRGLVEDEHAFYALTFDDGYLDNRTTLLPILEHHNVPAAIFITTGFVGGQLEPFEYALAHLIRSRTVLNQPNGHPFNVENARAKAHHYEILRRRMMKAGPDRCLRLLTELQTLNNDPPIEEPTRYMLNWDEVAELNEHPLITIGAHCHTHPVLSRLSPRECLEELRKSRSILEAKLKHRIDTLAYPYGSNNFLVRALAGHAGFDLAFSTDERTVSLNDLKRSLALPRFSLNSD